MAKIDRSKIDTWLSGTKAANGAKSRSQARQDHPSSASEADDRLGFSEQSDDDVPAPAFGVHPESENLFAPNDATSDGSLYPESDARGPGVAPPQSDGVFDLGETSLKDTDTPGLPSYTRDEDPVGLVSLLDRLSRERNRPGRALTTRPTPVGGMHNRKQ